MPNLKSAKKRVRISDRKRKENIKVKGAMKTSIKKAKIADKKDETVLANAFQKIDKALKKGIIKKNTAARKKAKLTKKKNT